MLEASGKLMKRDLLRQCELARVVDMLFFQWYTGNIMY